MLEENGTVVAVEEGLVWVQTEIKTTCGQCHAKDNCGTGAIAKAFSPKPNVIAAHSDLQADLQVKVGDSVVIGIDQHFIIRSAFYVYILPILGFMLFAGLSTLVLGEQGIFAGQGLWSELISVLFSFFGGWLGYLLARHLLGETGQTQAADKCRNNRQVRLIAVKHQQIPITFHPE